MFIQILGREVTTVNLIAEKHNLKTKEEKNFVYDVTKHYDDLHLRIKGQDNKKYIYGKIGEKFKLQKHVLNKESASFFFVTKKGYEKWLEKKDSVKCEGTEVDYLDPIIKLIDERDRYKTVNLKLSKENDELRKCLNGVQKLLKEVTE